MYCYWNTNSTTRVRPEVVDVVKDWLDSSTNGTNFHNPSDITNASRRIYRNVIKSSREKVAELICAGENSVIFTSGGTEGNNLAFHIGQNFVGKDGLIITSAVEHDSIGLRCDYLKESGYNVYTLPVDNQGRISFEVIDKIKMPERVFVSVMLANNELGNIYDIEKLSAIIRKKCPKALIHTDAVQAIGKMHVDVKHLGVDMLSLSGHKIGAPKGIGALYVKEGVEITPFLFGHQECGKRGGTENIAYIAALGKAAELVKSELNDEYIKNITNHRDRLEKNILGMCRDLNVEAFVNGDVDKRLPNTTSLTIKGIDNLRFLVELEARNIYLATGAACSSSLCGNDINPAVIQAEPSRVLRAINHSHPQNVIRISVGDYYHLYTVEDATTHHPEYITAAINYDVKLGCLDFLEVLKTHLKIQNI